MSGTAKVNVEIDPSEAGVDARAAAAPLDAADASPSAARATSVAASTLEPDRSPSHLLHRAQQAAADLHAAEFGAQGLTQRQVAVLAAVARKEGATQSDLVSATGIDRSTLAEMVARMTTKGLIVREKSRLDGRANAVALSEAGRAALADAGPRLARVDAALLEALPAGRRGQFLDLLTRIAFPDRAADPSSDDGRKKRKKDKGRDKTKAKAAAKAKDSAKESGKSKDKDAKRRKGRKDA